MISKNKKETVALVIVIIIMVVLATLGAYLANLESIRLQTSPLYYRRSQNEFLADTAIERAKQLLKDREGDPCPWRPWNCACPPGSSYTLTCEPVCSSCDCTLVGCNCSFTNPNDACDSCYLEECLTIPPGGKQGCYRIYISGARNNPTIIVETRLDVPSVTSSP
jgi:Tfp pilus assembly protein PilX